MALLLHPLSSSSSSSTTFTAIKPHLHHTQTHTKPAILRIKSEQDSPAEEAPASPKNPGNSSSPGSGFGAVSTAAPAKKKQAKGKRERAAIIRRDPLEKPSLAGAQEGGRGEEVTKNESAFLLAWLGLGAIILVEGIALAASGFLPETWDKLLGKYLYPSFTPTVFFFIAGTTGYGVFKYLQNENEEDGNSQT